MSSQSRWKPVIPDHVREGCLKLFGRAPERAVLTCMRAHIYWPDNAQMDNAIPSTISEAWEVHFPGQDMRPPPHLYFRSQGRLTGWFAGSIIEHQDQEENS